MTDPLSITCRVSGLTDLTPEIRCVTVVPEGPAFHHRPGQYAKVTFDGMPQRDYSLANVAVEGTGTSVRYEFHIRRERTGIATRHVFEALCLNDTVTLTGPFGNGYLRETHDGPVVAIGGGSGLAPMKAIVDATLKRDPDRAAHLYIGARDESDLYLLDHFQKKRDRHAGFRFTPVLSEPANTTDRRTGFVHQAVLEDRKAVRGAKIYMAGPPMMIEAAREAFLSTGFDGDDLHYDLPPAIAKPQS